MKLETYALRQAAMFRDAASIVQLFAARYPQIAARANEGLNILVIPYEPPNMIRLSTPDGSFSWNTGGWYVDWLKCDSNVIRYAPDFHNGGPPPLR